MKEKREIREQKEIDLKKKMAEYCPHLINTINSLTSKISLNFKHKRYKETVLTFLRSMMKSCMVPLCSDQNMNHPLVQCILLLVT